MTLYKNICGENIALTEEEETDFYSNQNMDCIDIKKELAWKNLRELRNVKLSDCDWTMLIDVPLTDEEKKEVIIYRQLLRNLPQNTLCPCSPIWPVIPECLNNSEEI